MKQGKPREKRNSNKDKRGIINTVQQFIQWWLEEDYSSLRTRMADNVVMCIPQSRQVAQGRESVQEVMQSILKERRIKRYSETDFHIWLEGNQSIAYYRYAMEYEQQNQSRTETGVDFFVFKYHERAWQLLWRTVYVAS